MNAYLFDEHIPPDDGQSQAAACQVAIDAAAASITGAIRAGLDSGRYVVSDGMVVLAGTVQPCNLQPSPRDLRPLPKRGAQAGRSSGVPK